MCDDSQHTLHTHMHVQCHVMHVHVHVHGLRDFVPVEYNRLKVIHKYRSC